MSTSGNQAQLKINTVPYSCKSISPPESKRDAIDVSSLTDTAMKYISGVLDAGEVKAEIYYSSATYSTLFSLPTTEVPVEIDFPDSASITFNAIVTGLKAKEFQNKEAAIIEITLRISGGVTYTP